MSETRKTPPYRSVYLVFIDHSVLGAWPTRRQAHDAARVLLSNASLHSSTICGPYVLRERAR